MKRFFFSFSKLKILEQFRNWEDSILKFQKISKSVIDTEVFWKKKWNTKSNSMLKFL